MDTASAINFLVEHAAKIDSELAALRTETATKKDIAILAEQIREGTKAMRQYTSYVESMLNVVTRGQLSIEDQVTSIRAQMEAMEQRITEIEKRNPPQAA